MAKTSMLGSRNFVSVPKETGSGVSRAKKIADLYIKSNTDASGKVTDPAVYEHVINTILAPYQDDVGVQQKIAAYNNNVKSLKADVFEQDITLGAFKEHVNDALFARGDVMRDPSQMAYLSATALDNIVNGLDAAIDYGSQQNKSTDQLKSYRKQVAEMANGQRDLVNNLQSGTLSKDLDGYGYFVKTNPIDGSLVGAALMPLNSAPAELKSGMKRVSSSVGLGQSKLPVYLPVTQGEDGTYTARLYGNTWTGTGSDNTLSAQTTPNFKEGASFDISDKALFPIKQNDLSAGNFGKVVAGVENGQTKFSYFYRGADNKVRSVDQATLDSMKADPMLAGKVNGYMPLLNPDEVRNLGQIERFDPMELKKFSLQQQTDSAVAAGNKARQDIQDFEANPAVQAFGAFQEATGKVGDALGGAVGSVVKGVSSFFAGRKNEPNKPDEAPQGRKSSYSAPDVVDTGKKIFSNVG